jgi:short chain dehydrogenase
MKCSQFGFTLRGSSQTQTQTLELICKGGEVFPPSHLRSDSIRTLRTVNSETPISLIAEDHRSFFLQQQTQWTWTIHKAKCARSLLFPFCKCNTFSRYLFIPYFLPISTALFLLYLRIANRVPQGVCKMAAQAALPLAGKTAMVTGSSRGIGAEIAYELAKRGADVRLCHLICYYPC